MAVVNLPLANQVTRQFADFPDVDMKFASKADFEAAIANMARIPDGWLAYCIAEKDWFKADKDSGQAKSVGGVSSFAALQGNPEDNAALSLVLGALQQELSGIQSVLSTNDLNLDTAQEWVDFIKSNRELIESVTTDKISVSAIVNTLTEITDGKVLDARQGKVLKDAIDNLTSSLNTKLTGTLASDVETQINATVAEDNKFVSRSKLFNWWGWIKTQAQTITGLWTFVSSFKLSAISGGNDTLFIKEVSDNLYIQKTKTVRPSGAGKAIILGKPTAAISIPVTGMALTGMSISLWFKTSNSTAKLIGLNTTAQGRSWRLNGATSIMSEGSGGSSSKDLTIVLNDNKWHHMLFQWSGSTLTLFVDGINRGTSQTLVNSNELTSFIIGGSGLCLFDQVAVYNIGVGGTTATAIYNSGAGTADIPTANLIRLYNFEEGTGTVALDASAAGVNATYTNSPLWDNNGKVPSPGGWLDYADIVKVKDGIFNAEQAQVMFGDYNSGNLSWGKYFGFFQNSVYPFWIDIFGKFLFDRSFNGIPNSDGSVGSPSALVEIKSTEQGVLLPKMTTAQRDAIASPAAGLTIFNTTNNEYNVYNGGAWVNIASKLTELAGTGHRLVVAAPDGTLQTPYTAVLPYIEDATIITQLTTESNWSTSNVYTGSTIVDASVGQFYVSANWFYYFTDDTTPVRISRNSILHLVGNSGTPTISLGTAAGTSPSGISISGTDLSGTIQFTTGISPQVNSILATVTFNRPYSATPKVMLSPRNAATAQLTANKPYIGGEGTSTFTIYVPSTALAPSTTYHFNYFVIQ